MKLTFQFTHPGRGATRGACADRYATTVSIHAPREGCDHNPPPYGGARKRFNSRTPGGVRRLLDVGLTLLYSVSIHAPREGCDSARTSRRPTTSCFNSRTPGGVRLMLHNVSGGSWGFQFTHPGRGATLSVGGTPGDLRVSIHAPREGCDSRDGCCTQVA